MTTNQSPTYMAGGGSDNDVFKKPTLSDLNILYTDGESVDQDIFAEMRSNILLVSGEHYNRRQNRFYKRIRDSKELSQEQKLRLIKNHTRKICQIYANNILSTNPNVGFSPKDESSMHDRKVAEMHHAVWRDAYDKYYLEDRMDDWCDNFIQIGEVAVKIFYDPSLGQVQGYEPQTDPETGNPSMNEFQEMIPDETKPVMAGEFVFEDIYGFNLLRPPECKDMRKAEWLGIRKMSSKDELMRKFQGDEEKQKALVTSQDETYVIFDAMRGGYKKSTKQVMIREYYYRPSLLFPEGYFYITTKEGILAEGTLPGGLFPIVFAAFDKISTTPRGRSPIKTMRPYQAEINRSASKMAEHQITLGDDKLLLNTMQKVSAGVALPGVRSISYTGGGQNPPTILPGRSGAQYLEYMNSQISELYQVMMVAEDSAMKDTGQADPYALLFRAAKQKKQFQRYIKRYEKFMLELVHLYLRLAKLHLPDDAVVYAIGKNEQINIPEFRQYPDTCHEVKIEAQADDIDTKMGKQLVLNHMIQFVGPQMKPEQIGQIMKDMPFANADASFEDFTMDYDNATNDMLALDRGEQPPVNQYDEHPYLIKKLTNRTKKPDYRYLPPQVQQAYQGKIALHQQMEAARQLSIQRAQQGFIPTGGYLVGCDFYVQDPGDPNGVKTRRARVPYQAVEWLIQQLSAQGADQQQLQDMNGGAQAEIAQKVVQMGGGQPRSSPGAMPAPPPQGPQINQIKPPLGQMGAQMPGPNHGSMRLG